MNNNETDNRLSSQYIDLLDERLGGKALSCSDQWFAPCSNLVKAGRGVFKEGHFVDTGQWMDGWESRRSYGRKRDLDYDWCVLRLGVPGRVVGVDVDTNHFRGNAPEAISVQAASVQGVVTEDTEWTEILSKSSTEAHSQNLFDVNSKRNWTHLRLCIYPDGGMARFRAYGIPAVDKGQFFLGEPMDLASARFGGRGLLCSDMFYSAPSNLLMPTFGKNMGDGWETRRRRDQANDWAIVKLAGVGSIRKVVIDTAHFKGNFPDRFTLEAVNTDRKDLNAQDIPWQTVVSETPLYADQEHVFVSEINVPEDAQFTHVRLNIFPDGGVSRLRIFGYPDWETVNVL
ncbi:allantoicase [Porticoccus sp. W117]|uniref:allantoicase n=1 Tax=Porticoccus sp. W117 TaxID=3054777 RepID=UPI002596B094|nr:allantoicase [Porticoccus sp. W117]MDM3872331.1 allantoicase [Porticoccus sp. W117]